MTLSLSFSFRLYHSRPTSSIYKKSQLCYDPKPTYIQENFDLELTEETMTENTGVFVSDQKTGNVHVIGIAQDRRQERSELKVPVLHEIPEIKVEPIPPYDQQHVIPNFGLKMNRIRNLSVTVPIQQILAKERENEIKKVRYASSNEYLTENDYGEEEESDANPACKKINGKYVIFVPALNDGVSDWYENELCVERIIPYFEIIVWIFGSVFLMVLLGCLVTYFVKI